MTYATEIVQRYRIAVQPIWNSHFWPEREFRSWDLIDSMNSLKLPLFVNLVATRLGSDFEAPKEIFGPSYQAVRDLGMETTVRSVT